MNTHKKYNLNTILKPRADRSGSDETPIHALMIFSEYFLSVVFSFVLTLLQHIPPRQHIKCVSTKKKLSFEIYEALRTLQRFHLWTACISLKMAIAD